MCKRCRPRKPCLRSFVPWGRALEWCLFWSTNTLETITYWLLHLRGEWHLWKHQAHATRYGNLWRGGVVAVWSTQHLIPTCYPSSLWWSSYHYWILARASSNGSVKFTRDGAFNHRDHHYQSCPIQSQHRTFGTCSFEVSNLSPGYHKRRKSLFAMDIKLRMADPIRKQVTWEKRYIYIAVTDVCSWCVSPQKIKMKINTTTKHNNTTSNQNRNLR